MAPWENRCDPYARVCFGPFAGGSSSSSQAQSQNQTNVSVATTTNLSVDTSDVANALKAIAQQQAQAAQAGNTVAAQANQVLQQGEELSFVAALGRNQAELAKAQATVAAAKIAAGAGPSLSTILIVVATILGLAFEAGFIKLPRALRA